MSRNLGGIKLLAQQLAESVSEEALDQINYAPGESPIEKLFFTALFMLVHAGGSEMRELVRLDEPNGERFAFAEDGRRLRLVVHPQAQLEDWRVDFLIYSYDPGYRVGRTEGWKKLIVECDGHQFHERTKEQAKKDRSRDRWAQSRDMKVFRFTGSELWNDPRECAQQVCAWAVEGW